MSGASVGQAISEGAGAAERIAGLLELTRRLGAIIEEENARLIAGPARAIAPLQAEKERLAAAYARAIRGAARERLNEAGDTAEAAPLLDALREATRAFEAAARRQRGLLEGARAAGEGVLKAVAEAADAPAPRYARQTQGRATRPIRIDESA